MQRADFKFVLPPRLIAQQPTAERSASRLLALDGFSGARRDLQFTELPGLLAAGDLLVFNDTRVIPARVFGTKPSGGRVEILLERMTGPRTALAQVRASKGLKPGAAVLLADGQSARLLTRQADFFHLEFSTEVGAFFEAHGRMPLPPYIEREPDSADRDRYQTVFARHLGAVAAPTAGLHFDQPLLQALAARGIAQAFITLHVGAGTFQPLRVEDVSQHRMHAESFEVPAATVAAVRTAHGAGRRVVAVGTTVVRALETAAAGDGGLRPYRGMTDIFIRQGYRFRVIDALLTNFHLPESTLVMLCAAFVGRDQLLAAYAHAVAQQYRFFSFGDAMFLTPETPRV